MRLQCCEVLRLACQIRLEQRLVLLVQEFEKRGLIDEAEKELGGSSQRLGSQLSNRKSMLSLSNGLNKSLSLVSPEHISRALTSMGLWDEVP